MQIELELLAPAKNKSIGIAAIDCGADAVYIAGPKFGAREAAGNSISEIAELAAYAHRYGAKVYLVINTILYDAELEQARQLIYEAYQAGCDAIIIQDLGLLRMELPPIPLFASTQTNIRSTEQAVLLESLGFERLILARELSLEQIVAIKKATSVPLESFIHGALCVSYSGQCYLSQKVAGRSANRGCCAQACRSNYTLMDNTGKVLAKEAPLLSLKDFNLSGRIPELVAAGVTSFKIEGRLKNESYIKNIVLHYRREIDSFLSAHPEYKRASWGECRGGFPTNPSATFNRGYTQLFLHGERGKWLSEDGTKHLGEYIGEVALSGTAPNGTSKFTYTPAASSLLLQNGDGLCFITPKGEMLGARANRCAGQEVFTTERIKLPQGSKIYRNYNIAFERELERNMPKRVIPAELFLTTGPDGLPVLEVSCGEQIRFRHPLQKGETAINPELAAANITAQFSKSSGLISFSFKGFKEVDPAFYPASFLNGVRRELAEKITHQLELSFEAQRKTANRHPGKKGAETALFMGKPLTYLANCSNTLAGDLYRHLGAKTIAPAYEQVPVEQAELMRTKYCLRYELGLCAKEGKKVNEPLFLLNGKNKLQLKFDCINCEMVILG